MADKPRKKAEEALLLALACGATVENAARQCGLCERTIYRRLETPEFRQKLQQLRTDMIQRSAGTLTAAATEAVRTLLELQKAAAPPAVRLGAARSILEIGLKLRDAALHDPNHADARHGEEDSVTLPPMGTGDVVQMLSARLRQLDTAPLPTAEKSRLTAPLADALLRAISDSVLDKRMEALQAVLLGRKGKD
jgi:hypothetical protein